MNTFMAELAGTALLIYLGCGVNAGVTLNHSYSKASGWIVITIGWGLAVTFGVYLAGQVSGAHINPAVTLSLAAIGEFPWQDVPMYILAQVLGAMFGATLVYLHYLPHWEKTELPGDKLGVFSTSPAIPNTLSNFISEFMGTFILMLGLLAIGTNKFADGLNPLVVGALIVAIGMSLGGSTGYAINPARDLGPRIAHALLPIKGKGDSNWSYAWIPVIAPIAGGIVGALFFQTFLS